MEREILDRGEVGRWAGGSPFLGYFDSPERRKLAVARGDSVRPPPSSWLRARSVRAVER